MSTQPSDFNILVEEAENENTSGERLEELAALNADLARLVASNSATPPEVLYKLAKFRHYSIRKNLAANPNTPTDVLLKLGKYFPEELLNNPVWSLLLLENMNLFKQILKDTKLLLRLLTYDSNRLLMETIENDKILIPELWLQKSAEHRSSDVCCCIATHPKTPISVLEKLALSASYDVRKEIARNPNTPVTLLEKLVIDEHQYVRREVACNPNTPVNLLEKLAENEKSYIVSTAIASNIKTPSYILENFIIKQYICYNDFELSCLLPQVISNPNTPAYIIEKLAEKSVWQVREIVARNLNTPAYILEKLAEKNVWQVRKLVACNPNTPPYILEKLAEDDEPAVRKSVASNSKTPAYGLEKIAEFDVDKWWILKAIANNPNTSINVLVKLAESKFPSVRRDAQYNLI